MQLKIGLIGCGAIGQFLLEKINQEQQVENAEIVAVFDEREKSIEKLENLSTQFQFEFHRDLNMFLQSSIDVVVECANIEAVQKYAPDIVKKKDLLLISIGALVDERLYKRLIEISSKHHTKVHLPTGAVGGLDLIKAANSNGGLSAVSLTSRKPGEALNDEHLIEETVLFQGTAKDAIEKFPKNVNVAIAISLAGIGTERTSVQIIADPNVTKNMHTIQLEGEFGKATVTIENNPSPSNPKTSYLTSLSILSVIRSLDEQVVIG